MGHTTVEPALSFLHHLLRNRVKQNKNQDGWSLGRGYMEIWRKTTQENCLKRGVVSHHTGISLEIPLYYHHVITTTPAKCRHKNTKINVTGYWKWERRPKKKKKKSKRFSSNCFYISFSIICWLVFVVQSTLFTSLGLRQPASGCTKWTQLRDTRKCELGLLPQRVAYWSVCVRDWGWTALTKSVAVALLRKKNRWRWQVSSVLVYVAQSADLSSLCGKPGVFYCTPKFF